MFSKKFSILLLLILFDSSIVFATGGGGGVYCEKDGVKSLVTLQYNEAKAQSFGIDTSMYLPNEFVEGAEGIKGTLPGSCQQWSDPFLDELNWILHPLPMMRNLIELAYQS